MSETVVTSEELQELRELQNAFLTITKQVGEVTYQKRIVEKHLNILYDALDTLDVTRAKKSNELQERLGMPGSVDLETGVFTPKQ